MGFLVNLAVGQLGSFVSLYVYTVQITERATGGSVLWAVVIGTNVLLVASFTAFLMKINEDKVAGFLSLETNPENKRRMFYEHDDPELKLDIFTHPEQW